MYKLYMNTGFYNLEMCKALTLIPTGFHISFQTVNPKKTFKNKKVNLLLYRCLSLAGVGGGVGLLYSQFFGGKATMGEKGLYNTGPILVHHEGFKIHQRYRY